MTSSVFAATFTVDRTPEEVFAAINDVRGWWSGNIEADTGALGAEFTYRCTPIGPRRASMSSSGPAATGPAPASSWTPAPPIVDQ